MLAEQIVGVQSMTATQREIFNIINPWSEWRRTTSLWPRRSIGGKWIFGCINKRGKPNWNDHYGTRRLRKREFATNKELFKLKLKGMHNG